MFLSITQSIKIDSEKMRFKRKIEMSIIKRWLGKWIILSLLWFVLNLLDFSNLQLATTTQQALLGNAIMAMLDSLVLCWVLARSSKRGASLAVLLFLAVFGLKFLLTAVEAVYLPDLQPIFFPLLLNGSISSLIWSITAVALNDSFSSGDSSDDKFEKPNWSQKWIQWLYKPVILAILWMMLFVIFGGLIFINLAKMIDPQALAVYSNLEMPDWVLPFQGLRALLWLLVSFPLLMQLRGERSSVMLLAGATFGIWMGSNLFMALDLPVGLRYAHLAEVMLECFVFGLLVVLMFTNNQKT